MARAVAFALLLLATTATTHAATFRLDGDTIVMRGEIVAIDPIRLAELIKGGARAIELESPGGLVAAGVYMADMIHTARLTTIVRGDCSSACTIMYYAGAHRQLSGRLGFHRASDEDGTARYAARIESYGAPRKAIMAVMTTPPNQITWLR